MQPVDPEFEAFVALAEPRLRRAFIGAVGIQQMPDAVAEALAYGWEHWSTVSAMENPIGYLFRVGQSRTRRRMRPRLPPIDAVKIPEIEPALPAALMKLPQAQRTAVWLARACGWSHIEIGEVLEVSPSTVSTHIARALTRLRKELGVASDA